MPAGAPAESAPVDRGERRWFWRPWLAGLLGIACCANSLPNGFTYDDKEIVRDNPDIRSGANWPAIWFGEWWASRGVRAETPDPRRDRLYRPLTLQTFALDYAVGGQTPDGRPRPVGFHVVNVFLHGLVCALAWRFGERVTGDRLVAGLAACIFAVHPIHSEAVANVVGRAELLAAMFLLGGLLLVSPPSAGAARAGSSDAPRPGQRRLAAACFLAALLSKESAVCYPVLAALVLAPAFVRPAAKRRRGSRWLALGVLLALPLVVYLPLRLVALDGFLIRSGPPHAVFNPLVEAGGGGRVIGALTIVGHYVRLMLFPLSLSSDYGRDVISPERIDAHTALGAAVVLAGVLFVAALVRRRAGAPREWRVAARLVTLLAASYALISNTFTLIGVAAAERLFYFPSLPAALLLALGAAALWRTGLGRRYALCSAGMAALVLGLLAARTIARNPDWRSDRTLVLGDVAGRPQSAMLQCFAGRVLLEEADELTAPDAKRQVLKQADRRLDQSLRIVLRNPYALHMRGRVRAGLLDYPAALANLRLAVRLYPYDAEARAFAERVQAAYRGDAMLRETLAAELARFPDDAVLQQRLGETLYRLGDSDAALAALRRTVELDPSEIEARRLIGEVLASQRRSDEALAALREALALDPQNWLTHLNLSAVLSESAPDLALDHALEAQRLRPDEFSASANVAEALALNGHLDEAVAHFRRLLIELAPDDEQRPYVERRIQELRAPP